MYHQQIEEVADIKKSKEALIMAAQEQVLSTRAMEAGVYHIRRE